MNVSRRWIEVLLLVCLSVASHAQAQSAGDAREVVTRAATALGGAERIRAIRTMRLRGYGHDAYQDGGSLISTEPTAPEKMTIITAYERVIDLANNRTRVRAKQSRAFVFAARAMMEGRPIDQGLDGTVAFDTAPDGAARRLSGEVAQRRRMELLANPIVAVRAALDANSRVTNRRAEGNATLVDVATPTGEAFTLAVTASTGLPLWVRWVGPHENLGDLTYRAEFSGYEPVDGVFVAYELQRRVGLQEQRSVAFARRSLRAGWRRGNLAAATAVRSAPEPGVTYTVGAESIASGVWLLTGNGGANSVLLEFANHLALFEVPTSRAWTQALIEKARSIVPGKPLTEAITSHHHFDHTGGLRTAIAEGLTIITQAGNVAWFEDLARRPVQAFPDALSRNPQQIKTRGVDDHLRLSDGKLTVDVYRVVSNNHMAHGLMAYIPEHRLLIQGDLFDLELGGVLLGRHVRGERRASQARCRTRRADSRPCSAAGRGAREAARANRECGSSSAHVSMRRDCPCRVVRSRGTIEREGDAFESHDEQLDEVEFMVSGFLAQRMALTALSVMAVSASAQQVPDIGFESVGRAAPLEHDVNEYEWTGAANQRDGGFIGAAQNGAASAGVKPLERDRGHVGRQQRAECDGRRRATLGAVGLLRSRLSARVHGQPLHV